MQKPDIYNNLTVTPRRAHSLDALRGYAIMTMILAATEAFGILPAWMYHAQVPPPDHDIIMLILANVSLTGAIVYLLTPHKPIARLTIIPLLMAFFMSAKTDGSWQQTIRDFTFAPWLYNIGYQKYLLVIIPGTIAGDLMTRWLQKEDTTQIHDKLKVAPWVALLSLALIITIQNKETRRIMLNNKANINLITEIFVYSRNIN